MVKKRLVSLLLSLAILIGGVGIIADASERNPVQPPYPIVIVRGMEFHGLWVNLGTDEQENCMAGVTVGGVLKTLTKACCGICKYGGFYPSLMHNAVDYCDSIMEKMYCDNDGNSVYDVAVPEYPLAVSNYPELIELCYERNYHERGILLSCVNTFGAENCYYFQYDWRLDHRDTADKLNELVERAKSDHDTDKVIMLNCSMGGVVTDAYIDEYGCGSLSKVLFLSSTFCGTDVATDLFTGRAAITSGMLYNYVIKLTGSAFLAKALKYTGVIRLVEKFAAGLLKEENLSILYDYFRRSFANMPAFWMNVQPEKYLEAVDYMFPTEELKAEHAGLTEKTDSLIGIMSRSKEFIPALTGNGVTVCVVAGYNIANVPLYESGILQGDGVLDSRWMLGGATVSAVGSSLGPDYTAGDPDKLSPDGCVDLSDVLFPEYTWAVRNGSHVDFVDGSDSGDFLCRLIAYNGQPTVDSFAEYPQFMIMTANYNYIQFS